MMANSGGQRNQIGRKVVPMPRLGRSARPLLKVGSETYKKKGSGLLQRYLAQSRPRPKDN